MQQQQQKAPKTVTAVENANTNAKVVPQPPFTALILPTFHIASITSPAQTLSPKLYAITSVLNSATLM